MPPSLSSVTLNIKQNFMSALLITSFLKLIPDFTTFQRTERIEFRNI